MNSKNSSFSHDNDLIKLLNAFPDESWNWYELSRNPNLTLDYLIDNNQVIWNMISYNPNTTWDDMRNNDSRYNPAGMSSNPNITWEIIYNNPDEIWYWDKVLQNPNITWEIIKENPVLYNHLTSHYCRSITFEINPNITWQVIDENPEINWSYMYIFRTIKFENDTLFQNLKKGARYNVANISHNPNITWEMIRTNPILPYNVHWDWKILSSNPCITWEIISDNPHIDWNWSRVIENPNITWEIIQNNPNHMLKKFGKKVKWYLSKFSKNPNLTFEIVVNNPQIKWDYRLISINQFKKHPHLIERMREYHKKIMQMM